MTDKPDPARELLAEALFDKLVVHSNGLDIEVHESEMDEVVAKWRLEGVELCRSTLADAERKGRREGLQTGQEIASAAARHTEFRGGFYHEAPKTAAWVAHKLAAKLAEEEPDPRCSCCGDPKSSHVQGEGSCFECECEAFEC